MTDRLAPHGRTSQPARSEFRAKGQACVFISSLAGFLADLGECPLYWV